MHVKLSDFLAKLAPEAKFKVEVEAGASLEEFIAVLTRRFGDEFRRAIVDRNGKLHADIAVVLNSRFIPPQQLTEHTINKTGSLSIIPIAGGG